MVRVAHISTSLPGNHSEFELYGHQKRTSTEFFIEMNLFLRKLGLNGTDCNSFRTQSPYIQLFELDRVVNAKPAGYKINFQYTVVANAYAGIGLSLTNDLVTPSYEFGKFDIVKQR